MERYTKVEIPIGSPEKTLKLCKKIIAKDTALGAGSPLASVVDMVTFGTRYTTAQGLQDSAEQNREDSEALHNQLAEACGIEMGQAKRNKDTLYWYVVQIRDILLIKNRGVEQNLEQWGFTVTTSQTGARKNVRVEMPDKNPETMVELAEAVVAEHTALGAGSPLTTTIDMTAFETKVTDTRTLLDNWQTARADMQAFHGQALDLLGYADGQTSTTPDTLYFDIIAIRDRLLQVNMGVEQNLEQWGFSVVTHAHSTGKKPGTKTVVREGDVSSGETGSLDGALIQTTDATMVTIEVSPNPLRLSSNNTEAAPSGPVFWDAPAGTTVKTISKFLALIGASEINHYIKIQNLNAVLGHFKITFSEVE